MIKDIKFANHDEWLAIRHKYIGGSDAAAVIGMSPYKSAYTLWAEKTDKIPAFAGNITTEVGAFLEEKVAELFTRETQKKVRKHNSTMVNDAYPFACANVDRLIVGEKAFLEIKTTNSFPIMRQLRNSDEFPDAYYAQCVHYFAVTGLQKCYLAVLVNCRELKIYEMERDEDEINALMSAEASFWENVKTNTPPAVDGTESTSDTLKTLYPGSNGDEISLVGYDKYLADYIEISQQIKTLKTMQDEAANKVKAYMGDSAKAVSDAYKVSWATSERRTFDTNRFVKDHPDMDIDGYYNVTSARTFKVTEVSK